jgi:outer membrane protein assembly factor BamB
VSASINSPALANGVVYIAAQNSLDALDALTGDLLWSYSVNGHNGSSAAVTNGMIYLNSLLNIYVFGLPGTPSGTVLNSHPPDSKILRPNLELRPLSFAKVPVE